jgi:hypothetical protein
VFKFVAFEDRLEREMGKPCLFALIKEQGFLRRWEVFLAAPWAESDPDGAYREVVRELAPWLTPGERADYGGVNILRTCDPFVCSLLERFEGHELVHEIRPMVIEEVAIERAFIINSCCAE